MATIVIVDDEPGVRITLSEFLRQEGHDVSMADGADAALHLLEAGGVDLIVTDLVLPGLGGLELLARIREVAPETSVIVMTGAPTVESAAEAVRRGAIDYLVKPVTKQDIHRAAGRALQLKALADTQRRVEELRSEYRERLEAEVAERTRSLQESQQFLSELVEHSGALVFVKNPQGRYELVNRQWELVTGLTRSDVIGRTDPEVFDAESARAFMEADRRVFENRQTIEVEEKLRSPDGLRFLLSVKFPLFSASGEVRGLCGMATDITERRRIENALRASEAELRRAQAVARVGSWSLDIPAAIVRGSDETCRILGFTKEVPFPVTQFEAVVHPADLNYLQDAWDLAVQGRPFDLEHRLVIDGETKWVRLKAEIEAGAEGPPSTALGTIQDITVQKQVEARFLRAQRMESIGSLAGGLAHDLNNILAPILIAGPLLRSAVSNPDDISVLDLMEGCAKRGADLIRQLLAFSRGSEGRQVAVQLRYLVRDTLGILRETLPRRIAVEQGISGDLWLVLGDPMQLQQVLMNLCVNARDAMPDGGELRIDVRNVDLQTLPPCMPVGTEPGRFVRIQVSDTGQGIPPELVDRVFEPFFTTKEVGKGTGLGLSTVVAIVKGHGGYLDVRSEPGRGTSFDIYLRALPVAPLIELRDDAPTLPRGRGETVLVVDDEPSVLRTLGALLTRQGFHVVVAHDGREALRKLDEQTQGVAVMVSDLVMPGMDGFDLVRSVLRRAGATRVVMVTGVMDWEGADEKLALLRELGVRHVLRKPCDPHELIHAISLEAATQAS